MIEQEYEYVVSELRLGGGYLSPVKVHAYNPVGRSVDFTIDGEDYDRHKLAIGDKVIVIVRYD